MLPAAVAKIGALTLLIILTFPTASPGQQAGEPSPFGIDSLFRKSRKEVEEAESTWVPRYEQYMAMGQRFMTGGRFRDAETQFQAAASLAGTRFNEPARSWNAVFNQAISI